MKTARELLASARPAFTAGMRPLKWDVLAFAKEYFAATDDHGKDRESQLIE